MLVICSVFIAAFNDVLSGTFSGKLLILHYCYERKYIIMYKVPKLIYYLIMYKVPNLVYYLIMYKYQS